jgi:ADP-ribose pyrophosphatase YjhB (NUDIX family)
MAQKYKIFFNEKLLVLEHQPDINKRNNIRLISTPAELLGEARLLNANNAKDNVLLLTTLPLDSLIRNAFTLVKAGGGLVFNNSGQLLFIKRLGLWDFPKGKLHHHESYRQGALREVSEETGLSELTLEGKAGTTYHLYDQKGKVIIKKTVWYCMLYTGNETGRPQLEESITDVRWFNQGEWRSILESSYRSLQDLALNFLKKT